MNKSMSITTLMESCEACMTAAGYTPATINMHHRRWINGICGYMSTIGATEYTPDLGNRYLEIATSGVSDSTAKGRRRSINILSEYVTYGKISGRIHDFCKYPIPDNSLGVYANEYFAYCTENKQAPLTIVHHKRVLSHFLRYLQLKGIVSIEDVTLQVVMDFLSTGAQRNQRVSTLRGFIRFVESAYGYKLSLLQSLTKISYVREIPLPSVYSPTEVEAILSHTERLSPVGKRDYAILLLASRLGLRASDIARISRENIDLQQNVISFIQHKTKTRLELPYLDECREAIEDYLRCRPTCTLDNIFIVHEHPIREMNSSTINSIVRRAIRRAGIKVGNRHFGTHALRHSLATKLLSDGTPLPTISAILGHQSTQSTMTYVKVDSEGLRKYGLEVPVVPESFYNQNGGVFYAKRSL